MREWFLTLAACWICTAGPPAWAQTAWALDAHHSSIRDASCVATKAPEGWRTLPLRSEPAPLTHSPELSSPLPGGVSFAGGWHLIVDSSHFGGLSGLDFIDGKTLLAVTDRGYFVQIPLFDEGPSGMVFMQPMRLETRFPFVAKLDRDAEGLLYDDGVALVSFERDFRTLAFDMDCAVAPLGVTIGSPPGSVDGVRIGNNKGPEALWSSPEGDIVFGYEQRVKDSFVAGTLKPDGTFALKRLERDIDAEFGLVGGDGLKPTKAGFVSARLFRAYENRRGNRIHLELSWDDQEPIVLALAAPMSVDNFEGVALTETDTGVRAYLISDDNFSERQRTLLFAFDFARPGLDNSE